MKALTLALCILIFACTKKEPPKHFPFRGTVVRLDPGANVAVIHNEDVKGWMGPMTMEYPIESREEYQALKPGEQITATVNVTSDGYSLANVRQAK